MYNRVQENWFERGYRLRREAYEALNAQTAEAYVEAAAVARARDKIRRRGYQPSVRASGDVHTYACIPSNWPHQNQIARALTTMGPVSRFDYTTRGLTLRELRTAEPGSLEKRARVQSELMDDIRRAHKERPIDWFLSYALPWDLTPETVVRIQEEIGIPTVNVSLDDKNWWEAIERRDPTSAMRSLVPKFDLGWTSARTVLPWYWAEGGQAIFLPEGVDSAWFRPLDVPRDIKVGFVGNRFGYRPELIETFRKAGIEVVVHGTSWPNGHMADDDMLLFFSRCHINLGLGDMDYSRWLTNLKGRDFEIPSTGRGVYVTTYNSDLADCFTSGSELWCYRGVDEAIELIRRLLRNPDECDAIAARGRQRCLRDHQWKNRFERILRAIGVQLDRAAIDTLSGPRSLQEKALSPAPSSRP